MPRKDAALPSSSKAGGGGGGGKKGEEKSQPKPSSSGAVAVTGNEAPGVDRAKDEYSEPCRWKMRHLMEVIKEEVALEGLDGITFQALKIRLEAHPEVEIDGFEDIASSIWTQIKLCKYFRFYMLPRARPDLVPYCWTAYRDERGTPYEPLHSPEEIYLYNPIEDKANGIRGSCMEYDTRKDITNIIKSCNYTDLIQLFGNRLVIVAHQHLREQALLGVNFRKHSNLSIVQYCIMERVGRARNYGEITRGKISSSCMNIPPKTLFYQRKRLLENKLVIRQSASIRFGTSSCPALVTVFHLPRFYKKIESMSSLNTRVVFTWLNTSPTKSIPIEMVISKYKKHTLRSLTSQFPTLLETAWEQREVDCEDGTKKNRSIRVLRLKNCDVRLQQQIISKVLDGQNVEDIDMTDGELQQDDSEQAVNLKSASSFDTVKILRPATQYLFMSEHYRLYHNMMRAGIGGLTLNDVCLLMSLTPLESRSATRFLTRHGAATEGVVKVYKQKAFTYVLTLFAGKAHIMPEKFMLASMEVGRLRELMEKHRKKQLEAQMKLARRTREIRESQGNEGEQVEEGGEGARVEEILEGENQQTEQGARTATDDVSVTRADPKLNKKSKKKKKADKKADSSNATKSHQSELENPTPEEIPVSLSIKIPLAMTRSPDKDFSRKIDNPDTTGEDSVPRSGPCLVAVISNIIDQVVERSAVGQTVEPSESTGDETPVEEIHTEDCLPEDLDFYVHPEDLDDDDPAGKKSRVGDSVDEEIKKHMTRQRVNWKKWEDRLMLLAFIASSLFIPKYNYNKVFMYNSPQIRDIMLKKTEGKSGKTSAAIRRRIHFLLHQQPRFQQYLAWAGAALKDDNLYAFYIRDHMPPPQQKIYFNPPIDALEAVIDYLDEKFADADETLETEKANSLNGIDTVLFLRQLKRAEYYWQATMFTIFLPMGENSQSRRIFYKVWRSLGGAQTSLPKKQKDTEQTEIEQKTPQDIYLDYCFKFLRFISKQCKNMFKNIILYGSLSNLKGFQVVSVNMSAPHSNISSCLRECNSSAEVRLWTGRCLVLEYVFSGDSSLLTEKKILTKSKFPMERAARSLQRAHVLVHNKRSGLLAVSTVNLRNFTLGLLHGSYEEIHEFLQYLDETTSVDSLACISVGILQGLVEMLDYFTPVIKITEQIFTLNEDWAALYDDMPTEEEMSAKKKKKKEKIKEKPQPKKPELVVAKKSKPAPIDPPQSEPPRASVSHEPKKPSRRKRSKHSSKRRRLTLEEEEEEMEVLFGDGDDCFGDLEPPGMVDPPRPKVPGAPVGLEEGESYISSSNSNALRLLRVRLNQAADLAGNRAAGLVEKDFFSVNLPSLEFKFPSKSSLNHNIVGKSHPFNAEMLKDLRKRLVELVFHRVPDAPFQAPNMERILGRFTKVFDVINMTGVTGISGLCLERLFVRSDLIKALKHMLESKLIFSVGVSHRRFVSYNNINDWVIPICSQSDKGTVGHVIMRPWITPLGGLSWITVSRLLTGMLGHLQKPAMPFRQLCQLFAPTLSPLEATILIEALAHLKYVAIYRVKEPEVSLWSPTTALDTPDIEYNADTLIDTNDMYVAVSPYVTFLHNQLNYIMQKAYRKQAFKEHQNQTEEET